MLSPYARTQRLIDSLTAIRNSIDLNNSNSLAGLATKVNIADTASMLSPYARTQRMIDSLAAVRNSIDLNNSNSWQD